LEKIQGLSLTAIKIVQASPALARAHYEEHAAKPWFPDLERYFTSGPVVAMIWEGPNAVAQVRERIGTTDPAKSVCNPLQAAVATTDHDPVVIATIIALGTTS
jgi:nucleoside-diphosphate kinase